MTTNRDAWTIYQNQIGVSAGKIVDLITFAPSTAAP
jgi:hypothetical protein